ncbi:Integrin alpha-PS1, partial [Stegodyphus mimosarum]
MACAHRFILAGDDYQWGQGICYSLTQELELDRAWEPCKNRPVNKAHEQYGYCQAGTSGEIAEDNTIIIGSPGPFTWRGTVFANNVRFKLLDDRRWYYGPIKEETSPVDKYSYLGMSVTTGVFFDGKRSFVGGAPRSNGTGQVIFFTKGKVGEAVFDVQLILNGEQFASSFGYTLASIDINSDGYLDLAVGAPFYYSKAKGGAVYIYMNSPEGIKETDEPIKITGKPESRFGFAIENAGDLNRDGYPDLVIGAPYEEGGGTVYIYSGSMNGIIKTPSQIIRAEDVPKVGNLQTFGYSLDGGIDIDGNGYPDLLVGSYESNVAVLLRSRPVLDIVTSVSGQLSNIDPDKKGCEMDRNAARVCFSFQACFQFNSSVSTSEALKLQYKIEADTFTGRKYYRVRFKSSLDSETPNIVEKQIVMKGTSVNRQHCSEEVVYLKDKSDIQNPIQFKLTYSLIQKDPLFPLPGSPLPDINMCPILNQQEASKIFEAKFLKDCGSNDICESDLDVVVDINLTKDGQGRPVLYLGEKQVALSVKVTNSREPAYDAMLYVFHPASLSFVGRKIVKGDQIECVPFNTTVVTCELGNPLKQTEVELQIKFNPKDVAADERSLKITVKANTTSHEVSSREDISIEAGIVKVAELEIRGASQPEQAFYGGESSRVPVYVDDVGSEVVHIYEIINHGPWLATGVEVVVSWPYEAADSYEHGKWLLYIVENPEVIGNGYCELESAHLNPLKLKKHLEELRYAPQSSYRKRAKREVEPQELRMDGKIVKVVSLDCDAHTAKCFQFTCHFKSLERDSTAVIKIKARLWNNTFVKDYPDVDWVSVNSRALIRTLSDDIKQEDDDDFAFAETKAYPDIHLYQKPEEVALWIIILAACAGVLLLVILILILWKCGFFKRKKPGEGYGPAPTHDKEYM